MGLDGGLGEREGAGKGGGSVWGEIHPHILPPTLSPSTSSTNILISSFPLLNLPQGGVHDVMNSVIYCPGAELDGFSEETTWYRSFQNVAI